MEPYLLPAQISKKMFSFIEELFLINEQISFLELHSKIEDYLIKTFEEYGYSGNLYGAEFGWAFPLGISVNEVIAHDSCNLNDKRILSSGDLVKIDLGVHISGYIIDSARTFVVGGEASEIQRELIDQTKKASEKISENLKIGTKINTLHTFAECLNSPNIRPVDYLNGHSIERYTIHGSKRIPYVPSLEEGLLEAGVYAIETFATTGPSKCIHQTPVNHFQLQDSKFVSLKTNAAKKLLNYLKSGRDKLPFSGKWLPEYSLGLKELVVKKIVLEHPVLADVKGSLTAQFEQTVYLDEDGVHILN